MKNRSAEESYSESISSDIERFKLLSTAYQEFGKDAGVEITPYRDPKLTHFAAQPEAVRRGILESLDQSVRICKDAQSQGHGMSNSPALIWAAFKEFGFVPPSDLFTHINRRSVIEVHSAQGIQIFRNFNFYKYCSYSLEELYTIPWMELFDRDKKIIDQMIELATQVFMKQITTTVPMNLPSHSVRERFSPSQHEVKLSMRWIAPLYYQGGTPAATVVIETISFVDTKRPGMERPEAEQPLSRIPASMQFDTRNQSGQKA